MSALVYAGTFSKDYRAWGFPEGTEVLEGRDARVLLSYPGEPDAWYLDLTSSLGQNILGYTDTFASHVMRQVKHGSAFTLPHRLERQVADKLAHLLGSRVPGWSPDGLGVRFGKSGSDATTAAVRLARAVTGRDEVLTFRTSYHGWHSWTIGRIDPAHGVAIGCWDCGNAEVADEIEWGDRDKLIEIGQSILHSTAAIIFEHPASYPPDPEWYNFLRGWCNEHRALLIADEVVTGLRYAPGGACERYGVEPDLVCMAKALGNGAAVSALVGRREHMDWFAREDPVFWSSTTNGNAADLAAADFVLDEWLERGDENVARLWAMGDLLIEGLRSAGWDVFGHGARSVLRFGDETERAFFIQGMRGCGVLCNRPNFPNLAMTDEDMMLAVGAATEVRRQWEALEPEARAKAVEGRLPRVLFKGR